MFDSSFQKIIQLKRLNLPELKLLLLLSIAPLSHLYNLSCPQYWLNAIHPLCQVSMTPLHPFYMLLFLRFQSSYLRVCHVIRTLVQVASSRADLKLSLARNQLLR